MYRHAATIRLVINFALFQLCWLLAFFFQAQAVWAMLLICIALFFSHEKYLKQLLLLAACLPIGIGLEVFASYSSLIVHPHGTVPSWLIILWIAFILTFDSSLKRLFALPKYLGSVVFALFAPISYITAANFGIFDIIMPIETFYLAFSMLWLICTLFIIRIYDWLLIKR
ncbi:hypothetical protein PSECIP111951_03592 [Pseudoalteromonas holothuriae]|uniref:DUF2878 domain-containing protein n=1 Tax=Pseudoalteromonas holothuriae TaxID=2963714 RepID=A0A9W4R3G7_9GAMM|nr:MULTISPECIES: DUF2878 domain-containing protein [unclassified Pseudoalteromonas]CAH9065235.1 hypothetical protein PSECIP111854_03634 [Pseudoalteromonas sp. CIP111854]CAH9066520.1 hypothetical protein PSECIP111951_03592 [Pseudoalteromonas sp. CIP111951]